MSMQGASARRTKKPGAEASTAVKRRAEAWGAPAAVRRDAREFLLESSITGQPAKNCLATSLPSACPTGPPGVPSGACWRQPLAGPPLARQLGRVALGVPVLGTGGGGGGALGTLSAQRGSADGGGAALASPAPLSTPTHPPPLPACQPPSPERCRCGWPSRRTPGPCPAPWPSRTGWCSPGRWRGGGGGARGSVCAWAGGCAWATRACQGPPNAAPCCRAGQVAAGAAWAARTARLQEKSMALWRGPWSSSQSILVGGGGGGGQGRIGELVRNNAWAPRRGGHRPARHAQAPCCSG